MTKAEIVNEIAKKTGIEKSVVLSSFYDFLLFNALVLISGYKYIAFFAFTEIYNAFFFKNIIIWLLRI